MARIKKSEQTHVLTEKEMNHVKILNIALNYNVLKDKAISGFLYYVCNTRFDYPEDSNLIFEIDLDSESNELKVRSIPADQVKAAQQEL